MAIPVFLEMEKEMTGVGDGLTNTESLKNGVLELPESGKEGSHGHTKEGRRAVRFGKMFSSID
jgi:hypothetical protein